MPVPERELISVEVENRSGVEVDDGGAVELAGRVLRAEGIESGELGIRGAVDVLRTRGGAMIPYEHKRGKSAGS